VLSKACQYAIKALIFIGSDRSGNVRATLGDIANAIDSPPAFTSKILQKLVFSSIITSVKGGGGGFEISQTMLRSTRLIDVIKAIEDDNIATGCLLGLPRCSEKNPCPVHHLYAPVREKMNSSLFNVTLTDIIKNNKNRTLKK
jgi:Rrf2 family transcriptional regulator, iron-sulfur cluster assembly transcription factor